MTTEPVDLFVGQTIALLPILSDPDPDPDRRYQLQLLFPRAVGQTVTPPRRSPRPRVYSVIWDGEGEGVLTAGGKDIDVSLLPLDVDTPPAATAFLVVAVSGRALRVKGIAEGRSAR